MFKAFVLVRNLESNGEILDFGEFTIKRVGPRFSDLRAVFSSLDVNQDDWILEKSYNELPPGTLGYPVGGIPNDIEDILLLLRLYRSGDISFIKLAIVPPSGEALVQFPNRAVNDLNSYSDRHFKVESAECESWKAFADDIRKGPPWNSHWFTTARRFFLSGGAKPFNPSGDDVDRVVDYATALESTLVPENDFNTRRISRRAAALLAPDNPAEADVVDRLIKRLYEIRSRMVHGNGLDDKNRQWLIGNRDEVEHRVRQVLATAVRKPPLGDQERGGALADLYDPTDEDRGSSAFEKFRKIKTVEVRSAIAAKISQLAGE